jgi:hypothetical protein
MTFQALSRRDTRTLAFGAATVILVLAIGKGLPRLRAWEAEVVALAAETANRVRVLEDDARTYGLNRDSVTARVGHLDAAQRVLIHGRTPDAAAATFASVLERLAQKQNVGLFTVTLIADSIARFGFARVTVRLSGETDVAGLLDLLYAIEAHQAPMLVRELMVSQPEPLAAASRMETLRLDLSVQTLARVDVAAKRASPRAGGGTASPGSS